MLCLRICFIDHEERIPLFTRASETDPELPYIPLLRYVLSMIVQKWSSLLTYHIRMLESQDDFSQLKATQILTVLLR